MAKLVQADNTEPTQNTEGKNVLKYKMYVHLQQLTIKRHLRH